VNESDAAAATTSEPVEEAFLLQVHPGTGVIDRHTDALLVVPSLGPAQWDRARQLVHICGRASDPTARIRARAVAAMLTEAEPDEVPGFALLLGAAPELTVIAYGAVEVTVRADKDESFTSVDSLAWIERRVHGPFDQLTVMGNGRRPADFAAPVPFHLASGIVPGSGITLRRRGATTGQAAVSAGPAGETAERSAPEPAAVGLPTTTETVRRPVRTFESVLLGTAHGNAPEHRSPLPIAAVSGPAPAASQHSGEVMVEGIDCPSGHFNHPDAKFCVRCGMPMTEIPHRVSRPRPPLGVLVTDDGAVFSVTGDYVIGRSPERDDAVASGRAQPLALSDADHSVSRVHAYLKITGWHVLLTDGGSSNGTFVSHSSPSGPWTRVATDTPTALAPGDRLRIGSRQLLFDSYHGETATNARH
jgi:hypothetical protein